MADLVWSERNELYGDHLYHDCAYSGALMCLVHAGFTAFPLGIYTPEEREALERSDDRVDETGATLMDTTVAVKRRYGVDLHVPETTDGPTELAKVGRAYSVSGLNGNWAPTDKSTEGLILRRWDPNFTGGHNGTMVPIGSGLVLWLDPEAPNEYRGDVITIAMAVKWARTPFQARWLGTNELGGDVGIDVKDTPAGLTDVIGPVNVYKDRAGTEVLLENWAGASDVGYYLLGGSGTSSINMPNGPMEILIDVNGDQPAWINAAAATNRRVYGEAPAAPPVVPPAPGISQAQYDADVAAANQAGYDAGFTAGFADAKERIETQQGGRN